MSTRLLLIDDEESICEILKYNLRKEGYEVDTAYSAEEALEKDLTVYDLFIVDIMMENLSGFDFAKRVRNDGQTESAPIIFCSALSGEDDTVMGLNIGADDYITKPFEPEEVVARVHAALRRAGKISASPDLLTYKKLKLYPQARKVTLDDTVLILTAHEYDILYLLMSSPEKVFSRESLYELVWKGGYYGENNTVNVHVSNLRKKLKEADNSEEYIQTVYGIGFKLA